MVASFSVVPVFSSSSGRPRLASGSLSLRQHGRITRALVVSPLLVLMALATGCVDQDPAFRRGFSTPVPHEVGGSLVTYDSAGQRFAVFKPGGSADSATDVSFLPWEHASARAAVSGDGQRLLVMDPTDRVLGSVDPGAGKVTTWKLPSEFTTFTPGPDGKHAVLWHIQGGAQAKSLVNPAEVGLVDLDAPPADKNNPRVATITGLSRPPQRVRVSPEIIAADGKHRIVWIEAVSMIGLADFGPSGVRTLVVPLTPPNSTVGMVPIKAVTHVEGATLNLYLIASNSNDVLHLSVTVGADKLGTSIDQLASGKRPTDLMLFGAGADLRVATLNGQSRDLAILNPNSGAGTYVSLAQYATRFVPFTDADQKPWALLWQAGKGSPWVQLVDLGRVEKKKGKAVDVLRAEQSIYGVLAVKGSFALRHKSGVTGLSLLDPATGKLTSFAGTGVVQAMRLQGASLYVHGKVSGRSRISRIELENLHGSSVSLSPGGSQLLAFGESGVAISGSGLGNLSLAIFASGDLSVAPAWLEGTFLTGYLDRQEVTQ